METARKPLWPGNLNVGSDFRYKDVDSQRSGRSKDIHPHTSATETHLLIATMRFATSAFIASLAASQTAYAYQLVDNIVGSAFLTAFEHQAIADPTHGRV